MGPDRRTRTKASVNWAKQRVRVARAHSRVRNARHNFHHQLAARLVRENQAVAVEALSVTGLARSGGTSAQGRGKRRSVADAGWGTFLRILQVKATEHGRTYAAVNPAYSSQTCSGCGAVDGPKPLNIREWTCRNCGAWHDRDQNAAINILVAAGLAETRNACGESVSPSA
jgi:putative transposase